MSKLQVGDTAPEFRARDQNGNEISLPDESASRGVVLFFYPKDGTPICTKQVCSFRDSYEKFQEMGFEVIGVSGDSSESHREFAERHHVPYSLITDEGNELRKNFGVSTTLGILPGRQTFVIDSAGIIRLIFSAQFAAKEHVQRALSAIENKS